MTQAMTRSRGLLGEEPVGDLVDGLARRALAHADQHDALADRHDVAALHAGVAPVLVAVAPPDLELVLREKRMELVDGPLIKRLGLAGRPEHRIAGHSAIDPAGRVALEQRVRDRPDDKLARRQHLAHDGRHHVGR